MKKILIFILSIVCLLSFAMATACVTPENKEEQKDPSIVLMNGFNAYDDLTLFDLNPTSFTGNWEINKDENYIVEGDGSWRISVTSTGANQPNFKRKSTGMKTDITDVSEFGLWVYSEADYEFGIIITAFAGDQIVCSPLQKVVKGANNLVFPINRVLIAQSGKVVSDYSISFSGIKSGTVVYLDNFYVKTTTEPIVYELVVKEVIDAISALSLNPTRAEVEAVMAKYSALSAEDKLCVSNADMLKAAIEPYYLADLGQAQVEDPNTLLYYDKPFGEVQVVGATAGIGSYAYSTEQKHGEEEGSLKVEFTTSSTNWVTLSTSATTLIEEEKLEFYVYNDSDQYKAMCIAWNGPVNPENGLPFYVLAPHEWTKFLVKSADLTDSQVGQNGTIQICGLASMNIEDSDYASARSPEGTMYFSSFVKKDDRMEIMRARTGEDANTLFFFDRELGLKQITPLSDGIDVTLSEDVKINGEDCLSIHFDDVAKAEGTTPTKARISVFPYSNELTEGKYVAFYAMAKLDGADYLRIRLGDYYGTYIHNNKTSLVLLPAEKVAETGYFKVEAEIDAETLEQNAWNSNTSANTNGYVYLSKAKLYTAEEVKNLTSVADDYEFNIGETTFVGKVDAWSSIYKGTYNINNAVYASDWDTSYYLVGDAFRVYARAEWSDWAQNKTRNTAICMEFKDAVPVGGKIYITACGLVEPSSETADDGTDMQVFTARESGHKLSPNGAIVERHEDGFVTWCFDVSSVAEPIKYFRLYTGHKLLAPDFELVTIRDIYIK